MDQRFTTPLVRLVTLWTSCPDKSFHDLEAATAAARTACDRTQWRSPVALQMLAGVLAARGSFDEALRWQSQAVELASGEAKDAFQKQLEVIQKLSEDAAATGPNSGS